MLVMGSGTPKLWGCCGSTKRKWGKFLGFGYFWGIFLFVFWGFWEQNVDNRIGDTKALGLLWFYIEKTGNILGIWGFFSFLGDLGNKMLLIGSGTPTLWGCCDSI